MRALRMASIRDYEKRLAALEAETASYRGGKFITFATLHSTGEILSASVDGQDVERLEGETDSQFPIPRHRQARIPFHVDHESYSLRRA